MFSARSVLDWLPRSSLRSLSRSVGENDRLAEDEQRRVLAVRFNKRTSALIDALTRRDLLAIFRQVVHVDDQSFVLVNPGQYSTEELHGFAKELFCKSRLARQFVRASIGAGGLATDDEGEEDDDAELDDGAEPRAQATVGTLSGAVFDQPALTSLRRSLVDSWGSTMRLEELVRRVSSDPVQRLRTPRFRSLLQALEGAGIELTVAGADEALDSATAESPGLAEVVMLRRTSDPSRGKAKVSAAPDAQTEAPLVLQENGRVGDRTAAQYELAMLRLELLTAVPCVDRTSLPSWPQAFLDAATDGLQLDLPRSKLLKLSAEVFANGSHDPLSRVDRLAAAQPSMRWERLLQAFAELNPHAASLVATVCEYVRARVGPLAEGRSSDDRRPPASIEIPRGEAAVLDVDSNSSTNQRSMGALDDIF